MNTDNSDYSESSISFYLLIYTTVFMSSITNEHFTEAVREVLHEKFPEIEALSDHQYDARERCFRHFLPARERVLSSKWLQQLFTS